MWISEQDSLFHLKLKDNENLPQCNENPRISPAGGVLIFVGII